MRAAVTVPCNTRLRVIDMVVELFEMEISIASSMMYSHKSQRIERMEKKLL